MTLMVQATSSECRRPSSDDKILLSKIGLSKGDWYRVLNYDKTKDEEFLVENEKTDFSDSGYEDDDQDNESKDKDKFEPMNRREKRQTKSALKKLSRFAKHVIQSKPKRFNITGPTNDSLISRQYFVGRHHSECVACKLDCMGYGPVFKFCKKRYYFYGCQMKAPCFSVQDGRSAIEIGLGICMKRNGCVLRDTEIPSKRGKLILKTIIDQVIEYTSDLNEDDSLNI
nr:unnamed protein product [Naegleria fowleri]